MSVRRTRLVFIAAVAAAAGPVLGIAAHADPSGPTAPSPYNATINQGNVPTTAAAYSQDCNSDEFGSKPADADGWLFVASPSNFSALKAMFSGGDVVFSKTDGTTGPTGTSAYYTKADDHLAVITPAGWTLTQAYATLDGSKDFFTLSHTCAATQQQPQQPPSTAATAAARNGSCDSVTFDLSAGSADRTFTIHRGSETTDVPVKAGQTVPQTVSLDRAHPSASVTENGNELASFTRPSSCNSSSDTTGGSSTEGGGVSGVTTSQGSPGKHGTTNVLGEKLTKTPATTTASTPTVSATTGELPMTGFNARVALEIAAGLLLLGVGMTTLGRRRMPTPQYIQVRN